MKNPCGQAEPVYTRSRPQGYSSTFNVWGVKATLEPEKVIFIDDIGYPVADTAIKYSVQPAEYEYGHQNAYLNIYENDAWIGLVQADIDGNIVLSRGTAKFDITKTYTGEVVINSGGNIQLRSQKVKLPIARVEVRNDVYLGPVDEIKFGNGSKKTKPII